MRMFLAGACVAIVAFLAGLWIGSRARPAAVSEASALVPPPAAPAPATDPEVLRALAGLADDVRALRQALAVRAEPSERVELASQPAPDLESKIERLEHVAARLEVKAEAQTPQLARPRDPATTPRAPACNDLFRELEALQEERFPPGKDTADERWTAIWNVTWGSAVKHWEESHRGWTFEQVAERYGAPDRLQADGEGPSYVYSLTASDGTEESFVFQSRHGLIYDVDVYFKKPCAAPRAPRTQHQSR